MQRALQDSQWRLRAKLQHRLPLPTKMTDRASAQPKEEKKTLKLIMTCPTERPSGQAFCLFEYLLISYIRLLQGLYSLLSFQTFVWLLLSGVVATHMIRRIK